MDVRKKMLIVGIGMVMLSAAVATQYARITVGYTFDVVHPSEGLIRFVACDNATDGRRLLRVTNNNTGTMQLVFGDIPQGMNKTYTASFAIVNEEGFTINITGVTVTGSGASCMRIWLHSSADTDAVNDGEKLMIWDSSSSSGYWLLSAGDGDYSTMGNTTTSWDNDDNIKCADSTPDAHNGSTDFVWVQISINTSGVSRGTYSGSIEFNFKAE